MITRTQVDGVETVLAPRTGPVRAGLVFRVGRADETLATAGITHLVEHLALHRQGMADYHYNGATSAAETHFVVQGTAGEVVSYLNGVCAALRDLPLERLDTEKEILRTEAAGRPPQSPLPLWRYGARGHGLVSCPELGLARLTAEDVAAWADRWFTRQNAVLWITADEVPDGLDLELPDGERRPAPEATSALPWSPAFFTGHEAGVVLHSVVERSTAAEVYSDLLGRALFRELRQEAGLSYRVGSDYQPRDAGHAVVTAVADALPEKREAVLGGFVDVLASLRMGRIDRAELESVRKRALEHLDEPDAEADHLPLYARDLLLGRSGPSPEEKRAELGSLTPDDLRRVAESVAADALLMTPAGTAAEWAGFRPAPTTSAGTVDGRHWPAVGHEGSALIVGGDGVSMTGPGGSVTVRYDECAALMAYPDGGRRLIGNDGITVAVEPTLFRVPESVLGQIDAAVPPAARVPMPSRSPEEIPAPPAVNRNRRPTRQAGKWRGPVAGRILWWSDAFGLLAFVGGVFCVVKAGEGQVLNAVLGGLFAALMVAPPATVLIMRLVRSRK